MSLVENLVSQISKNELGGITKPQGFNLDDSTFENLLQKALNQDSVLNDKLQILGNIGQPSGLIIEPLNGTTEVNEITPIEKVNPSQEASEHLEIKDVDIGNDYFAKLLKEDPQDHKNLMNVAKKYAASAYNILGKNFVENLADLALASK